MTQIEFNDRQAKLTLLRKQYEGFTLICNACGSAAVEVYSDMGYSPESESWGGLHLRCTDCASMVTLIGN